MTKFVKFSKLFKGYVVELYQPQLEPSHRVSGDGGSVI